MNRQQYRFDGILTRAPHPDKPSKAMSRMMPIENENDFTVFANLPPSDVPIYLNFGEHHQFLAALVTHAQKLWPEQLSILVRLSMPAGTRLPAPLLESNVLLCQEIEPELSKLQDSNQNILVIEDFFVRFQIERGNNDIHIQLFTHLDSHLDDIDDDMDSHLDSKLEATVDSHKDKFNALVAPLEDLGVHAQ